MIQRPFLRRPKCDKNARQRSRLPSHFAVAETTESPLGLGPTALGPSGRNRNGAIAEPFCRLLNDLPIPRGEGSHHSACILSDSKKKHK